MCLTFTLVIFALLVADQLDHDILQQPRLLPLLRLLLLLLVRLAFPHTYGLLLLRRHDFNVYHPGVRINVLDEANVLAINYDVGTL